MTKFGPRTCIFINQTSLQTSLQLSEILLNVLQIGLVNVLAHYGIHPSGVIGHSLGELACGYADGGLTLKETVLAAYWRGQVIKEARIPKGKMAAAGKEK